MDRHDVARSALVLAVGALVAFATFLVLKRVWRDLDCGDDHTIVLDGIRAVMVLLAAASVLVGGVAILLRTQMRRSIVAVVVGGFLLLLLFLPASSAALEFTVYVCGVDVV